MCIDNNAGIRDAGNNSFTADSSGKGCGVDRTMSEDDDNAYWLSGWTDGDGAGQTYIAPTVCARGDRRMPE